MPRKSHRQTGGDQGRQGVQSDPCVVRAQSSDVCVCVPATQCATGVSMRRPRDARAYVSDRLHIAPSAAPATQKPPAERRRPRDARAYIRPLAEHQVPHLPRKSHRQSGGDQGTPGRTSDHCRAPSAAPATQKPPETKGRQGVHPTPCRAPSAAPATQKSPAERRRPRDATAHTCHAKATGRAAETRKVHCQGVKCKPWRPLSLRFLAWQAWDNVYCYGVGCTPWRPLGLASIAWQAWDNALRRVGCTPWRPLGLRLFCVAHCGVGCTPWRPLSAPSNISRTDLRVTALPIHAA